MKLLGEDRRVGQPLVGMKRLFLITLAVLLLSGIGVGVWTVAGLPPVRMVWGYGFTYGPEPTGRTLAVEGVEFVEIGPGCFLMGSNTLAEGGDLLGQWFARFGLPWGDQPKPSNEMPVHWVEFPHGFWIALTELTNEQYEAFDPKHERSVFSPGDNDPVVEVSREDATRYCAWLSEKSGQNIRLPSESEWECACRAGSDRDYCIGDDEERLGEYAWYLATSDGKAREVGTRRANAWGLHDLHGNVWEWCEDPYHENYENAPVDGTAWMEGGKEWEQGPQFRVNRGGSWLLPAGFCRSARRLGDFPGRRFFDLGFRPAFSILPKNE